MNKKNSLLIFICLFVGLWGGQNPVNAQQDHPNILFISIDDLNTNIGAYGDSIAITPNIDKLASKGTKFTRAYVQQPICNPSRASILTGMRPHEVEVTDNKTHFRSTHPDVVTLPQLFKNNGYQTVGLGKIFHWSPGFNDTLSWSKLYFEEFSWTNGIYSLPQNKTGTKAASMEMSDVGDDAYVEGMITDKAISELTKFVDNQKPFFLGVGYFRPHLPYTAPKKYWDLYDFKDFRSLTVQEKPIDTPEIAFHNWQELRGYSDIPDKGEIAIEKQIKLRQGYYASITYIDAQIGRIIEALENLGLNENTIIVIWSDHGYHLGDQNLWAKTAIFEKTTRAPLIISAPTINQSGRLVEVVVEFVDLYPTIIDLSGLEPQGKLSGKSLRPLLVNPNTEWSNVAYSQIPRPYHAATGKPEQLSHWGYSVRTNNWRYTAWYNVKKEKFEHYELYEMSNTNLEIENLAGKKAYSEVEEELHKLIEEYQTKFD